MTQKIENGQSWEKMPHADVTEQKFSEEKLMDSEVNFRTFPETEEDISPLPAMNRFYKLFNNNPALMAITNLEDNKFVEVNTAFINKLGFSRDEIIGKTNLELGIFEDRGQQKMTEYLLQNEGSIKNIELKVRKKDGQLMDVLLSDDIINNPREKALLTVMMDITEQKKIQVEMGKQASLILSLIDSIHDIVFYKDIEGIYLGCNSTFAKFFGKSREEIIGKTDYELFDKEIADISRKNDIEMLRRRKPRHNEEWITYPDGRKILVETIKTPYLDAAGRLIGIIGVSRDITERHRRENEVQYLSFHDQLTGLYNRRFFEEELKRIDVERNLPITILMSDINGLKLANDAFGHAMGDELLKKAADAIKKGCRADDIIARTGGDEFHVILPRTDAVEAEKVIQRIKDLLAEEKVGALPLSISFGTATKVKKKQSMQDVITVSEDQMYRYKILEKSSLRKKSIDAIMNTMFDKYHDGRRHSNRVAELCELIARKMNLSPNVIKQLRLAGQMHDIGKIGIDAKVLNKTEQLYKNEWEQLKKHPEIGYRILSSASEFSEIAMFVLEHHERWDGTGYPKGLKGGAISLPARIIAIADFYDTMTQHKTYGKVMSEEAAKDEIRKRSGTQFDPDVVRIFIENVLEICE